MFEETSDTLWYAGNNQFYFGDMKIPTQILLNSEEEIPAFWSWGTYYQKSSLVFQWLRFGILTLSLISILVYLIYATVWLLLNLLKRNRNKYRSRLILWFACVGFMMIPFGLGLTLLDMVHANRVNVAGLSIFLGSIALFVLSIVSVILSLRQKNESKTFQMYFGFTSLFVCLMSLYFLKNNIIGFMMWSY